MRNIPQTTALTLSDFDILATYIPLAWRTLNSSLEDEDLRKMLVYGLVGELAEIIDLHKKIFFHNHPMDRDKIVKECGDVLWYLSCIIQYMNTTRTQWMQDSLKDTYTWKVGADLKLIMRQEVPMNSEEFRRSDILLDGMLFCNNIVGLMTTKFPKTLYVNRRRNSTYIANVLFVIKNVLANVNCSLQECLDVNVAKLKARYPNGFSDLDSQLRRDEQP